MGYTFEGVHEVVVEATPEQVWEAIATGPGIDSWFMGRNEVVPPSETGEAGAVRMTFGGYTPEHRVTAWDPQRRLVYRTDEDEDGRYIAYEYLIEGRGHGSTVLRLVASGFLPGDDWETEYEAMTTGGELFFRTLVTYLTYFAGRTAVPVTAFGPTVTDWEQAWARLHKVLGLAGPPREGDRVRATPDGLAPIDGVVYHVNAQTLGVRTDDALYRFIRGLFGAMVASHHLFADGIEPHPTERAWRSWLAEVFA